MADYLVYWKTYWSKTESASYTGGDWSTSSESFYDRVKKGDRLWVVITGGKHAPREWRLLGRFTVSRRSRHDTQYGKYQMYAQPRTSASYKLELQPDLAAILRLLSFKGGTPIRVKGPAIGKALQSKGYRSMSEKDGDLLLAYSATLAKPAHL